MIPAFSMQVYNLKVQPICTLSNYCNYFVFPIHSLLISNIFLLLYFVHFNHFNFFSCSNDFSIHWPYLYFHVIVLPIEDYFFSCFFCCACNNFSKNSIALSSGKLLIVSILLAPMEAEFTPQFS